MIQAHVIRAKFDTFGSLERALHSLKDSGQRDYEAYGPVNLTELEELMPQRGSWVHTSSFFGAVVGLVTFMLMCVLSSLLFALITGGKPPISFIPFVIVSYEGTILIGALATFFAVLVFARIYPGRRLEARDVSATGDTFGIRVTCAPDESKEIIDLLNNAGATEIDESQH